MRPAPGQYCIAITIEIRDLDRGSVSHRFTPDSNDDRRYWSHDNSTTRIGFVGASRWDALFKESCYATATLSSIRYTYIRRWPRRISSPFWTAVNWNEG